MKIKVLKNDIVIVACCFYIASFQDHSSSNVATTIRDFARPAFLIPARLSAEEKEEEERKGRKGETHAQSTIDKRACCSQRAPATSVCRQRNYGRKSGVLSAQESERAVAKGMKGVRVVEKSLEEKETRFRFGETGFTTVWLTGRPREGQTRIRAAVRRRIVYG